MNIHAKNNNFDSLSSVMQNIDRGAAVAAAAVVFNRRTGETPRGILLLLFVGLFMSYFGE